MRPPLTAPAAASHAAMLRKWSKLVDFFLAERLRLGALCSTAALMVPLHKKFVLERFTGGPALAALNMCGRARGVLDGRWAAWLHIRHQRDQHVDRCATCKLHWRA